jgi:hypothetical protein
LCLPDQLDVNAAFTNAARSGNIDIMQWLATRPNREVPSPDETGVNSAFTEASFDSHMPVMKWLVTQPNGLPLPNQASVDWAFNNAIFSGAQSLIKWLLTGPNGLSRPSAAVVHRGYEAIAKSKNIDEDMRKGILELLKPCLANMNRAK